MMAILITLYCALIQTLFFLFKRANKGERKKIIFGITGTIGVFILFMLFMVSLPTGTDGGSDDNGDSITDFCESMSDTYNKCYWSHWEDRCVCSRR